MSGEHLHKAIFLENLDKLESVLETGSVALLLFSFYLFYLIFTLFIDQFFHQFFILVFNVI